MLVLRVWKIILVVRAWAHTSQKITLISTKIMRILKFLFILYCVFKHKYVLSNQHVCTNDLGKMWASYIFHLSTRNLSSTHRNSFNFFFLHNKCHDVQQWLSARAVYKNTWQTCIEPRNLGFLIYFSSIHYYWHPNSRNSLVHNSWSKMEQCEKCAFQFLKMRIMNRRWNIKTKYVTDFLLSVRSSSMKDYTSH